MAFLVASFSFYQKTSERTQKQLKAFAKQHPEIKQPDSEPDQSLKR